MPVASSPDATPSTTLSWMSSQVFEAKLPTVATPSTTPVTDDGTLLLSDSNHPSSPVLSLTQNGSPIDPASPLSARYQSHIVLNGYEGEKGAPPSSGGWD